MKRIFVICLILAGIPAFAQKIDASKVPASVKTAFSKNFPGVTSVKWEKEKGNYEANFKEHDQKMSALFDATGGMDLIFDTNGKYIKSVKD
jgi:hypothetical protein